MFAKTLMVGTALAAGLLMLEIANPVLAGGTAHAAQVRQRAVARPAVRAAPRANFQRSNVVRSSCQIAWKCDPTFASNSDPL